MFLHQSICISSQRTNDNIDLETITPSVNGKLFATEPILEGVPPGMLRRMSKAVRLGVGAGLPLLQNVEVDGIVMGTANGGMEDCIKFLNQIVDYNEGLLTPANFVQSTPNAIAGQLSLIAKNQSYNATHIHNGLAFENALLDTKMLIQCNPDKNYLVGGVDEISSYNYNIDTHAGWYDAAKSNQNLYANNTPATIAGEGAAMFIANNSSLNAVAKINAIEIFQNEEFLEKNTPDTNRTLFLSGENGDCRQLSFYVNSEKVFGSELPVARYKHISGEYPTSSSFAVWLAAQALKDQRLPKHFYKRGYNIGQIDRVVLYNQYQLSQYSFIVLSK